MAAVRVLIVGCGNIGGLLDRSRKSSGEPPLTHAGAYLRDGRFELVACVEPDADRRAAFMSDWRIPIGFRSIDEVLDSPERFDVISICSPTPCHAHDVRTSLKLRPKLLFCEKPLASSALETESLVRACRDRDIPLAVNYTRRWDPAIAELRTGIEKAQWGPLRSVVGYYNKGLLNNGSHMLDVLSLLLGPLRVVKVGRPIADFSADDTSVPVWLETATHLPVHLACGHAADFALFELQLLFADAMITMEEAGMFWRERKPLDSAAFAGYRVLDEGTRREGLYPQAMLRSVDNIFRAIKYRQPLASTG
ncbi:MAG: Gfo/Idh/MocA family protein, partial [Steroidobacteraceae bacterium]